MKHGWWLLILIAVLGLFLALAAPGCGSDDSSESDDDGQNQRPTCNQAIDCGAEGRAGWKCADGYCFSLEEYCESDDECEGKCTNHVCEGGRIDNTTDGDQVVVTDGDEDAEPDGQVPCEFECCTDEDCSTNSYCDVENHLCVLVVPCDEECCQDWDCWQDPNFGDDYVCKFNKCINKNGGDEECLSQQDCFEIYGEGYICVDGECKLDQVRCTPGNVQCCTDDPGNPDCLELGLLLTEAILTCNATGDGYDVSMCDPFNDCISFGDGETIECFPNGRCEVDTDCECPKICNDTPQGMKCAVPTVASGEICSEAGACGQPPDQQVQVGRCGPGDVCCIGIDQNNPNNGYCTLEANCGK